MSPNLNYCSKDILIFLLFKIFYFIHSVPTIKQVFTSESALQAGIFSSVFKLGYYQETLPGLEKTEFVEPIAGTIEDLFEWCLFFPGFYYSSILIW